MGYKVAKLNGSLVITLDGLIAYHMPFWVRVNSRSDLQALADAFNQNGEPDITAIMAFETRYSTKKLHKPY